MKSNRFLLCLIVCVCAKTVPVLGQESPKDAPISAKPTPLKARAPEEREVHVFRLQYAQASSALDAIQSLLGLTEQDLARKPLANAGQKPRFAIDTRLNRLIAFVDEPERRAVEALLRKLDQPQEQAGGTVSRLKIFRLRHARADDVESAIQKLSLDKGIVASYADARTNTLYVTGNEEAIADLGTLIDRLDVPTIASKPRENVALRVVWLVDKTLAGNDAAPVPSDWKDSIERLRKQVDVGELRMATQLVITFNPAAGARFRATAEAKLKQLATLTVEGTYTQKGEPQLQLELNARYEANEPHICNVQTTCSGALQWQPVILGATTFNSQPSVFVIQLLPK